MTSTLVCGSFSSVVIEKIKLQKVNDKNNDRDRSGLNFDQSEQLTCLWLW